MACSQDAGNACYNDPSLVSGFVLKANALQGCAARSDQTPLAHPRRPTPLLNPSVRWPRLQLHRVLTPCRVRSLGRWEEAVRELEECCRSGPQGAQDRGVQVECKGLTAAMPPVESPCLQL